MLDLCTSDFKKNLHYNFTPLNNILHKIKLISKNKVMHPKKFNKYDYYKMERWVQFFIKHRYIVFDQYWMSIYDIYMKFHNKTLKNGLRSGKNDIFAINWVS